MSPRYRKSTFLNNAGQLQCVAEDAIGVVSCHAWIPTTSTCFAPHLCGSPDDDLDQIIVLACIEETAYTLSQHFALTYMSESSHTLL